MHQLTLSPPATYLDHATCYRALCAKDSRFDGEFFVGVSTTGIYCRPVCRVKTPRASSCTFYPNASAAEAAGFRPCLRCRPELAPYALQQNLAYAVWQRIAAGALNNGGTMNDLAQLVGLSTRQLQRLMHSHFGVSPIELAQTTRLLFAKKLLQETHLPMTEVAYAAGFGSVRRFNALFLSRYCLAPTAIRRHKKIDEDSDGITLRLAYRAPLAWNGLLDYLKGRAISGVECIEQGHYVRSVLIDYGAIRYEGWLTVTHLINEHQLEVRVASQLAPALMPLLARVRELFDLDANPIVVESYLSNDALLAPLIQQTSGLRIPGVFNRFELAIRAVLGQQISVAAATTLAKRLVQTFGTPTNTPFASITHHFPEPITLLNASLQSLINLGLPKARAATLLAVAQFTVEDGLETIPGETLEQVITRLKTVPGIGDWTANYIALRVLRFPNAFPAGDLGLQKALATQLQHHEKKMSENTLLHHAKDWSPWRGYAAMLLWNS